VGIPIGKRGLTETDMGDRFANADLLVGQIGLGESSRETWSSLDTHICVGPRRPRQ
jgi:hypothetical protein